MVEIKRNIITIVAACACSISVVMAQQVQPRIDGLETNANYMGLLVEDNSLTVQEDSISVVVESLRTQYRTDAADSSRERIISLENQLFELRARKAAVVDSLNMIEQAWVLDNMNNEEVAATEGFSQQATAVESASNLRFIYESPNVKSNLSNVDYRNLVRAEELEREVEELSATYIVNYDNMLSLSRSYEAVSSQDEAMEIREKFDSLKISNIEILRDLNDSWGYIYDNKSFAYSLLMELMGFTDVLDQEAELMRKAQAEVSAKLGVGCNDELIRYLIQKRSMLKFENIVAEQLGLGGVVDLLKTTSSKFSLINDEPLDELSIEERSFILYESIEFVTKPVYTASNPIPQSVVYEKGTIFRIFVGSFLKKQPASIFRGTTPVSYLVNEQNRNCYYVGGFETYDQAVEAKAKLKKRGFRAPQIVVWYNGKERNLSDEPLEITTSYRIEISDAATLPSGANEMIVDKVPGSSITKVGTDKFVIMSLERQSQVDSLVEGLHLLDPNLKIAVDKSETKIEF